MEIDREFYEVVDVTLIAAQQLLALLNDLLKRKHVESVVLLSVEVDQVCKLYGTLSGFLILVSRLDVEDFLPQE